MNNNLIKFFNEISSKMQNLKIICKDQPFDRAVEERFGFEKCYIKTEPEVIDCNSIMGLIKELYEEKLKNEIERTILGLESEIKIPLPVAVLSIESTSYTNIQDLLYTLFESVFSYIKSGILYVYLPIDTVEDLEESVSALHESITDDLYINARIGVGLLCKTDVELRLGIKTSEDALYLCSEYKKDIIFYHQEWLPNLILSIPKEAREKFVKTNIKDPCFLSNEETLKTIATFLDCDLNLSQASRLLFIHRNTLSYRLDKIYDDTGLDIRNFEDAMKMKICLEILGTNQLE